MATAGNHAQESFLPDLCGMRALFAIVIIGELLAFVLTLARSGVGPNAVADLALISFYTQWVGLSAAAALCLARRALSRIPEVYAAVLSYLLVLLVILVVCEFAWWVVNPIVGMGAIIDSTHQELIARTLGISAIVAAVVLRYFYVQHHWRLRTASEASARLEALQARIRPHFFFNCMNTIASLTRSNPERAERAVEDLADLFRASMSESRTLVTLAAELELARRYLDIEALRLGPRLSVAWQVDTLPLDVQIPLLSLQPLLENAIYHGIEPCPQGGTIKVEGHLNTASLEITVSNPLDADVAATHSGNRLAQDNVRQRLYAHFGEAGRLQVETVGGEYRATLSIPLQSSAHATRHR